MGIHWDDGGEYARAAEAAGVDVGGMLEAGVEAKQLLEYVASFRKDEGDKLGLLDEQHLKFATSQVLREGPMAGADIVYSQLASKRPRRAPLPEARTTQATGMTFRWKQNEQGSNGNKYSSARRRATSSIPDHYVPPNHRCKGIPSARSTRASAPPSSLRVLQKGDDAETARLCDELSRWSSALEGAERHLGAKGVLAGMRSPTGGNGDHARHGTRAVPTGGVLEEDSKQSTFSREKDADFRREEQSVIHRNAQNDAGRLHSVRVEVRGGDRRRARKRDDNEVNGDRDRTSSPEGIDDIDDAWEEVGRGPASSPWRRHGLGAREGVASYRNAGRTPSYALPTKHFKTVDRGRRHALYAEDIRGQKQMQRQAHLEEENAALKLRLEGQRRTIHELEHQANTLRERARIRRQEEVSRLKKTLATNSSSSRGRGKCTCGANTHHACLRTVEDTGPSALKKRALAAEARAQSLERCLSKSKAMQQRSKEVVAYLKDSYSSAQAKVADLEAELESTKKTLSESRKEAKGRVKDTRKHRRQQGAKEREAEVARADAADLALQLRKASREIERARLEAIELREDKARVESESKDLARENRILQDRLNDGKLRSRVQERDREILAELRSESRSMAHRSTEQFSSRHEPPKTSRARRQPFPRKDRTTARIRVRDDGGGRRRPEGVDDSSLESESASEPSLHCRSLSPSTRTGGPPLPPRDDRRV
ncbi:unnamed protein product, partial [Hapterophycus canaliculatus]